MFRSMMDSLFECMGHSLTLAFSPGLASKVAKLLPPLASPSCGCLSPLADDDQRFASLASSHAMLEPSKTPPLPVTALVGVRCWPLSPAQPSPRRLHQCAVNNNDYRRLRLRLRLRLRGLTTLIHDNHHKTAPPQIETSLPPPESTSGCVIAHLWRAMCCLSSLGSLCSKRLESDPSGPVAALFVSLRGSRLEVIQPGRSRCPPQFGSPDRSVSLSLLSGWVASAATITMQSIPIPLPACTCTSIHPIHPGSVGMPGCMRPRSAQDPPPPHPPPLHRLLCSYLMKPTTRQKRASQDPLIINRWTQCNSPADGHYWAAIPASSFPRLFLSSS